MKFQNFLRQLKVSSDQHTPSDSPKSGIFRGANFPLMAPLLSKIEWRRSIWPNGALKTWQPWNYGKQFVTQTLISQLQ
jgi:hypothetical protein